MLAVIEGSQTWAMKAYFMCNVLELEIRPLHLLQMCQEAARQIRFWPPNPSPLRSIINWDEAVLGIHLLEELE